MYKLLNWIDKDKINWGLLSENPNAIQYLEKNQDKLIGIIYQEIQMQFIYLNKI
jgi:hypothetical protein